ncbi:MAG TPA: LytTR family DNA-binding domain-containing protein, partial [Candidatus Koribacter sp.]
PAVADVIAVLDEVPARKTLHSVASLHFPRLTLQFLQASSALTAIGHLRPRIVILQDAVQSFDGLAAAQELLRVYDPSIILLSATETHAARAFEVGVADYVTLPLRQERLLAALQRVVRAARQPGMVSSPRMERMAERSCARLRVKSKGGFVFLHAEEIAWINAAGNYLDLYCNERCQRIRETLTEFQARLDSSQFLRIHRSIIVNANYIRELRSWGAGEYVVVLYNGKELPVSRSCRDAIDRWMADELARGVAPLAAGAENQSVIKKPRFTLGPQGVTRPQQHLN